MHPWHSKKFCDKTMKTINIYIPDAKSIQIGENKWENSQVTAYSFLLIPYGGKGIKREKSWESLGKRVKM